MRLYVSVFSFRRLPDLITKQWLGDAIINCTDRHDVVLDGFLFPRATALQPQFDIRLAKNYAHQN